MSLSGALSNALSGLTANARAAGLVSTNIANANTESYGRRTLALTAPLSGYTGGVRVDAVMRHVDQAVLSDRRQSDAALAGGNSLLTFASDLELQVGNSDDPGSLTSRLTAFENALLTAASSPSSTQRLESVAFAADAVATKLNSLSSHVQDARTAADNKIALQVGVLNDTLGRVKLLNTAIAETRARNEDTAGLKDERHRLIDQMAEIVPLRLVDREHGKVAIYTAGGAVLLDREPITIGFDPATAVSEFSTLSGGALSGLTMNGIPVNSKPNGMFSGGDLAAQFEIRDEIGPQRQAELDGIARDLIERLGFGGPDTTLGPTDPGLFTDLGAAFDPANELGVARRIQLNGLVEPGSGGSWRLRDGLNAVIQGPVGEARLLQGYSSAISALATPSSASLPPVIRSFADRVADFSSEVTSARVRDEAGKTYLASQNTILSELELADGVDTDQELQHLMRIEQQYAANARMMSVVDELLERLMAI